MPYSTLPPVTDEVWSWNNTPLNWPFWNIGTWGGSRFALPTLRGQDVEVAYRAGKQNRSKYPDSRTVTLVMWTAGIDPGSGQPAVDQRLAFNNNWQQIRQLFWTRSVAGSVQGTLQRQWYITQQGITGLVTASALGEIAGTMEPTMTGRTRADFSVDVLLADPYFYGASQQVSLPLNVAQSAVNLGEGIVGEGYPSSLNAFSLTFNGPLTLPTVTNAACNVSASYLSAIPSGVSVTYDLLNFLSTDSSGVNQIAQVGHAGSRMWFCLVPGANLITLTSASSADSGNAVLNWNPPYL
jgi:hypothetical protein